MDLTIGSVAYKIKMQAISYSACFTCLRACKGFDGGFEIVAAIRRHRARGNHKYKR